MIVQGVVNSSGNSFYGDWNYLQSEDRRELRKSGVQVNDEFLKGIADRKTAELSTKSGRKFEFRNEGSDSFRFRETTRLSENGGYLVISSAREADGPANSLAGFLNCLGTNVSTALQEQNPPKKQPLHLREKLKATLAENEKLAKENGSMSDAILQLTKDKGELNKRLEQAQAEAASANSNAESVIREVRALEGKNSSLTSQSQESERLRQSSDSSLETLKLAVEEAVQVLESAGFWSARDSATKATKQLRAAIGQKQQ